MSRLRRLSLHTPISLVLTGLAASFLLVLAGLWLQGAGAGIHEEVEAANRVSLQWLQALSAEMQAVPPAVQTQRVLGLVRPLALHQHPFEEGNRLLHLGHGAVMQAPQQQTQQNGQGGIGGSTAQEGLTAGEESALRAVAQAIAEGEGTRKKAQDDGDATAG